MLDETKIHELLSGILDEFRDNADELPARLERIRTFATSAVHSVAPKNGTVADVLKSIDRIRDSRIDGGFTFNDMRFQSRPSDRENIMGACQMAIAYIGAGGDPNETKWADPSSDFEWILEDNSRVVMSAGDVVTLFQAGVAFKTAQTFYARGLKDSVSATDDPWSIDINTGWPE